MFGTFEDSLDALFSQDTNEEKRRKKELEEKQSRELQRALELEEHETKMRKFQTDYLTKSSQREEQLRALPNAKTREKTEYSDFIKSHYGFTPDNKKKKVLAGILEGVGGIASSLIPGLSLTGYGQGRVQARNRAEKDYKSDYDKLLGVERLEAQQYRDQGKLQQDAINASLKGGMAYNAQDIMREKSALQDKTANRKLDITKALGEAEQNTKNFLAYWKALETESLMGKTEATTKMLEMKNAIAEKVGVPVESINNANLPVLMSKVFSDDTTADIIKNSGALNKTKEKPKDPLIKLVPTHSLDEQGLPKTDFKIFRFDRSGKQIGGSDGAQNIPGATPAQQLSQGVRQTPLGKEVIPGSGGRYFPKDVSLAQKREIIQNTPLGSRKFGDGSRGIALEKEYSTKKEGWDNLARQSMSTVQSVYDGIATGDTKNWKSAFLQNPIVKKVREATGKVTSAEAFVQQNEVLSLLEHMQKRYGSRPAHALIKEIKNTLEGDWDNDETYAKKAGSIHLMIQLSKALADDPRMAEYLDDANDEVQKDKERTVSFATAFQKELDESLSNAKQGKRNSYPTLEGVFKKMETKRILDKDYEEKRRALGLPIR